MSDCQHKDTEYRDTSNIMQEDEKLQHSRPPTEPRTSEVTKTNFTKNRKDTPVYTTFNTPELKSTDSATTVISK